MRLERAVKVGPPRRVSQLFFHLIDMAVLNAHILYLVKTGKKPSLHDFTVELVRQLLEAHSTQRRSSGGHRRTGADLPMRLTARHFLAVLPSTQGKKYAQKPCHVCRNTVLRPKMRKDTRYCCVPCDVALCLVPCFEAYHTLQNY